MHFDIGDIIKTLPHAYPFLLVDKVIECEPSQSIKAIKNVTYNEPFFVGHFPGHPVMPGVLIIESLAQTAAICALINEQNKTNIVYFMSIENAKFRKPVVPGDTLLLSVNVRHARPKVCKFECTAHVGEERVTEATILAMIKNG